MGVNEWVAAGSALLALASFVLNWAVINRQIALQYETLKAEMDAEVIAWAHEAIDAVSDGVALARGRGRAYNAEECARLQHKAAQRLSSLADRGRLFFPNEAPDSHGQDKETAFQGYRQPILDAMVFASERVQRMAHGGEPDEEAAAFLTKCRRLLVSEAQNAIDPRRRDQMLRRLAVGRRDDKISAFAMAAEIGEAMEARYPGTLEQRRDATWVAQRETLSRRRR